MSALLSDGELGVSEQVFATGIAQSTVVRTDAGRSVGCIDTVLGNEAEHQLPDDDRTLCNIDTRC